MTWRPVSWLAAGVALLAACSGDAGSGAATTTAQTVEVSFGQDFEVVTTEPEVATTSAPPTTESPQTTAPPTTAPSTTAASPTTAVPTTVAPTTAPPTTVSGPPQTSCTSVIHVGDSTSVSLISPSFIPDPAQRVDGQYRRVGALDARTEIDGALSTSEVLSDDQINAFDRVRNIKAGGYEGCWVFALGGNDTANLSVVDGSHGDRVARIERMMSAIGDDPVMWVNVKTLRTSGPYRNENMLQWNDALRDVLPRYPNMRVFDWASVVQDGWFLDDAIHYTAEGSVLRGTLIANALAEYFPA